MMLKLYFSPGASSMAPHIALHEIGVPFEAQSMSFHKKEHRAAEFLAINPEGRVPVLMIDGRPLTEVAGILYYLARRFPEAALLPRDEPEAEAHAVSWMSFIASRVHPARGRGMEYATKIYKLADEKLGATEWAIGRYSIADIHLFRLYWRFESSLKPPPGMFPNLTAHHQRMMARPAVKKTIEIETAVGYELPA